MQKILFIINPVSGVGKQKIMEELIPQELDSQLYSFDIQYTERAKHAIELSRSAVGKYDVVVAVGGDGSVNEIAQALIGTETILGIIPTGSGNGLARHLQISRNPQKALQTLNQQKVKTIDTILVNNRYCVNVAGLGFDARVSHEFANFGKRGFIGYAYTSTKELIKHELKEVDLLIDGVEFHRKVFLLAFANSPQWGFNAYVAPTALIDDGYIEISIANKIPFYAFPEMSTRMFTQSVHKAKYVETIRAKEVIINNNSSIEAHLDGEPVMLAGNVTIRIVPLSLKVLVG